VGITEPANAQREDAEIGSQRIGTRTDQIGGPASTGIATRSYAHGARS
jgi:hypothetical protein